MGIGGGKSSGSQQSVVTQEQKDALKAQTDALTGTLLPAYKKTMGMADTAYGQTNPSATNAANTALDVAGQTGALQQAGGTQAYQSGLGGQQSVANSQQSFGNLLSGKGASGAGNIASQQQGLSQGLTNAGAGGTANMAGYQQGVGQSLTGQGASQLSQLFSPDYAKQQVSAALQPAMEQTREAMGAQNAGYGAAGGLGSSRAALASQNLQSLSNQRLGTVAAQTQQGIEANRAAASQAILGAGQNASNQAQNAYGNLLSTGQGAANTAAGVYGNLLSSGQGATGQAGSLYGNLAGQGSNSLAGANQAAAARIGYAQTPQDVLAKYASVIYGSPQQATTPNFQGTQGTTGNSKGFGFSAPLK